MYKQLLCCLLALLFLSVRVFGATNGKIRDFVTDKDTKDSHSGVNAMFIGATMGAAANIYGDFNNLNVPIGTCAVKASFVGCYDAKISKFSVIVAVTTEANYPLFREAPEGKDVFFLVEQPVVDKNETHLIYSANTAKIEMLPVSRIASILDEGKVILDNLSFATYSVASRIPDEHSAGRTFRKNSCQTLNSFQIYFGVIYNTQLDPFGSTEPTSLLTLPVRNYLYEYGTYSEYFNFSHFIHSITDYTLILDYINDHSVASAYPICDCTRTNWPECGSPVLNPTLPGSAWPCDFNVPCLLTIGYQNAPVLLVNS